MAVLEQWLRDKIVYASGYLQGRSYSLARSSSPSAVYGALVAKATSFIALPLPLLSFLAVPFVGGSSTTFNLVVFYLTWTALVTSHEPLTVELGGTLLVRLLCFLGPALGMLAFDCAVPQFSQGIKARGSKQSPLLLGRDKLLWVASVAIFNVLLAVALQGGSEYLATQVFHLRSLLRVSMAVPLPWTIAKDLVKGLLVRGTIRYVVHRYLLHTYPLWFQHWHQTWQHSVPQPFSLVAAYDHPINHVLSQWVPTFLPACVFRFHVLEWHVFLAIASLEDLFVYSGYAVLPSGIVLPGMARRNEAHFNSVQPGKRPGNFGHLGVLDLICRTTCADEGDVLDDLQSEAVNHHVKRQVEEAVHGAVTGLQRKQSSSSSNPSNRNAAADRPDVEDVPGKGTSSARATAGQDRAAGAPVADADDADQAPADAVAADETADEPRDAPGQQRRLRRRDKAGRT
ncbi:hypothetical protein LTR53_012276 [Teratosphaeriaceae sp. CCFEE 6253]|nr:hypothetical protein LTR53_012276 [Teratosphaeriaceae sp. CCFEE 6253]